MAGMDHRVAASDPPFRESGDEPAFDLVRAAELKTPLVFASPHSGRLYPDEMLAASALGPSAIRRSEDALVDALIGGAAAFGVSIITARFARAYVDVNREPYELDASMFEDELPAFARAQTPRIAAGLGAIARTVGEGQEIYARKLVFADARRRIERVHRPYHAALADLIEAARARFGGALLLDWHSMPSAAARGGRSRRISDFVLGDRFGASCKPAMADLVERELRGSGFEVTRNAPYAGGYTTEFYGDPGRRVQALQIEINRALYLDEETLEANQDFATLAEALSNLSRRLAARWRDLI